MENEEQEKLDIGNSTDPNQPQGMQPSGAPEPPFDPRQAELGTIRTLATVGAIGAPVSLIIGGTALSTASIVCAIIALVKLRKFKDASLGSLGALIRPIRLLTYMGLVVGCFAFILNFINMMIMIPLIMEAMTTGDYSSILGADGQGLFDMPSSTDTNPWG